MELDDPEEIRRKSDWRRKALARKWGVATRTVDRMRADGRLGDPAYYIGRIPIWTDQQRQSAERRSMTQR